MPWYFFPVFVGWIGSEILLGRLKRSGAGSVSARDRSTLRLLWLTLLPSIFLAVLVSTRTRVPICEVNGFEDAALLIMVAGILLRWLVVRSMGRSFTVDVSIVPGHELKTTGFHRYVRHPSYAFSLLTFLGFGCVLNNVWSLLLIMVPVFLAFHRRIVVEEAVLTDHFGDAYRAYASRTRKLIPFIY